MLMRYELEIQETWKNLKIRQIEHMISKPIFSTNDQGNFIGNFDKIFYTFLKENERLAKMDINIPSVNQFLIRRKDYFVEYNDTVKMILEKYNGVSLSFQKKLLKVDNELPLNPDFPPPPFLKGNAYNHPGLEKAVHTSR